MKIVVKELNITSCDVEKSNNLEELKILKIKLDSLLVRLSYDLDEYNIQYVEKGISGDYNWYKRAKTKKRLYGLMSQLIQTKIGFLGKKEKEVNRNAFLNILVEKIKQNIDEKLFYKLVDEAKSEVF